VPSERCSIEKQSIEYCGRACCTPLVWRLRAPDQGSTVGGLLSVSPHEEHHERRTFCRRGRNPRTCDSSSATDS
jgi:hypothetical protein